MMTKTPPNTVLDVERDRAERFLNAVRVLVLSLLGIAALVYAPSLTPELRRVNLVVLVPTLAWTILQVPLFYHRAMLPGWLGLLNPVVDISAVTAIIGGYGVAASPALALKSPIVAAYFIILAALPVASSTRKAAFVTVLACCEYAALLAIFVASGALATVMSPVTASSVAGVSLLDEWAKLLLLACAGAVATYATRWQERLSMRYTDASRASEQLQSQLDQAQLQTLKLQLQPHFLFNTLNAITALVHRDPDRAEQMVTGLSELLRFSLGSVGEQEITVAREIEVLEHYVGIQQVRFQDRLSVTIHADNGTQQALVPNLILQPLVENAIKHGVADKADPSAITIRARHQQQWLTLEVIDTGRGMNGKSKSGIGTNNTSARLQLMYKDCHTFTLESQEGQGTRAVVQIPWSLQEQVE